MSDGFIPYGRQNISESDIEAVVKVLRSDWLTQGPAVAAFEQAVAEYCGANHAVAVNSATSALHLACLGLGIGSGDIVWTSPITFVASANCARYCGADVDFVDIDPQTWNLSVSALAGKLEHARATQSSLPKAVIPVHLGGQSCDMAAISALSKEYGFRVIEDASHAIGGCYQDTPVGSCRFSDITVFSFHPVKIITTGEGGMALANDLAVAERMARLRTHGITRDPQRMIRQPDGPWYYEQLELGFNYRMTDLEAALGLSQLERLDEFVDRRNVLARRYDEAFTKLPIQCQLTLEDAYSARHLYVIRVSREIHLDLFEQLLDFGIGATLHYIPVHLQPYYRGLGFSEGNFPEAEAYYKEAISLPLFPMIADRDMSTVISRIQSYFV